MRYFSTFSGIGGFELGIHNAWMRTKGEGKPTKTSTRNTERSSKQLSELRLEGLSCVGYSEIDQYATSVYERHFPNHDNYGDITKINEKELPDFDCLVGGFPCQAFSIAGKRRGFEDTRGTLFFDLARILRAKQPRYFVFENVKGLVSHDNGNTFRTIITTIDELGYDSQWAVCNSKNHGVPQNRERIIIVGHLRGTPRPEVFPITGTDGENTQPKYYAAGINNPSRGYEIRTDGLARSLVSGESRTKNRIYINQLNQPTHSNDRVYGTDGISPTLNTMQGGNRQPKIISVGNVNPSGRGMNGNVISSEGLSSTLLTNKGEGIKIAIPEATKQGYAEATVGQAINLAVPASTTRRGRVSDISPTLDTGMQIHTLTNDVKIRRLTPIECERLQGFPDDHTKYGKDGELISDTQRYKMCGNAVTTNVIQAVFERIFANE